MTISQGWGLGGTPITQAVRPVISIQPPVKFPLRRTYGGLGIGGSDISLN